MKGRLFFILVVVAFVALVPLVYYLLFERGLSVTPPKPSAPQAPSDLEVEPVEEAPRIPVALSVVKSNGKVEISRGGGAWKPAEEGAVLGPQDRIRTDPSASATLSMPGVFSVEIDAGSEFGVKSLAEDVARFLLNEGMVSADVVDNPDKVVEVAAAASVARTRGGSFKMALDHEGLVTLGTSRGSVEVEAEGKIIQVAEGHYTDIPRGQAPRDPIKIPSRLFLKVRWPRKRELSRKMLTVAGKTAPGARVRVNGVTVIVDSKGRFRKKVALQEGSNQVRVESYDVGGNRTASASPSLLVDTRPDGFQIRTSPEMWEKKKKQKPPNSP